jgi:hypothetical protein
MKKCIVCDNFAKSGTQFCSECAILYTGMEEEQWFKDLATMMKKQRYIDDMERYRYDGSVQSITKARRAKIGRPRVPLIARELIIALSKNNPTPSLREIARICQNSGINVSKDTVRRVLYQKGL